MCGQIILPLKDETLEEFATRLVGIAKTHDISVSGRYEGRDIFASPETTPETVISNLYLALE